MGLTNHLPSDAILECLVALTDREAGRDAPLAADEEVTIRRLLREDAGIRAQYEELRAVNAGLDMLLQIEPEAPAEIVALIRKEWAAIYMPKERSTANVLPDERF